MLIRHNDDDYEFELGENDIMEQQAGQQVRLSIKGSNNFGRRIGCDLFMTYPLLARLKKQIDDALLDHTSSIAVSSP